MWSDRKERWRRARASFPHSPDSRRDWRRSELHLAFQIAFDKDRYYLYLPISGIFVTYVESLAEVGEALRDPATFYKEVTGEEWPYKPRDRTPIKRPEITLEDLDL